MMEFSGNEEEEDTGRRPCEMIFQDISRTKFDVCAEGGLGWQHSVAFTMRGLRVRGGLVGGSVSIG